MSSELMQKKSIEWAEKTWNPMTGCRGPKLKNGEWAFTDENGEHQCPGCYAKRMAKRLAGRAGYSKDDPFQPTYHENRVNQPMEIQTSKLWFTFSMADWLDPGFYADWLANVLWTMDKCPQHRFITLTKQYANLDLLNDLVLPKNLWVGISVNYTNQVWGIDKLRELEGPMVKFVSFEPLMQPKVSDASLEGLDWIIIGARSKQGKYPAFQPKKEWVMKLITQASELEIPVFLKPNLKYIEKGWFDHHIVGMPLEYHKWRPLSRV